MGSRLILSSGFTIRRGCYARASSHRSEERRRRDRRGANGIMGSAYFIGGPRCQGRRCRSLQDAFQLLEERLARCFQLAQIGELLFVLAGDVDMPRIASPSRTTGVVKAGDHRIETIFDT